MFLKGAKISQFDVDAQPQDIFSSATVDRQGYRTAHIEQELVETPIKTLWTSGKCKMTRNVIIAFCKIDDFFFSTITAAFTVETGFKQAGVHRIVFLLLIKICESNTNAITNSVKTRIRNEPVNYFLFILIHFEIDKFFAN